MKRYLAIPIFIKNKKRRKHLTREVLAKDYEDLYVDGKKVGFYVFEELSDGPDNYLGENGKLWLKGERSLHEKLKWKLVPLNKK